MRISLPNRIQGIRHWVSLRPYALLAPLFGLLLIANQGQETYARHLQHTASFSDADKQQVAAALSLYRLGSPWSTQAVGPQLADVALRGQNEGGQDSAGSRTYIVAKGDTLSGIAAKYGLSSGSLQLANPGLQQPNTIQPGQKLVIPDHEADATALAALRQKQQSQPAAPVKTTLATVGQASGISLSVPLAYTYISQGFGPSHPGLDLVAPLGTPIYAVHDGCVAQTTGGWAGGYGNSIVEDIGGGYTTRYAHMLTFADGVHAGACVTAGTLLGYVGLTGHTTGPHLHFELRLNGTPVRPTF